MCIRDSFRDLAMCVCRTFHGTLECIVLDTALQLQLQTTEELMEKLRMHKPILEGALYRLKMDALLREEQRDLMMAGGESNKTIKKTTSYWFCDWKMMFDKTNLRLVRMIRKTRAGVKPAETGYQCVQCDKQFGVIDEAELWQSDGTKRCPECGGEVEDVEQTKAVTAANSVDYEQLVKEIKPLMDQISEIQRRSTVAPLSALDIARESLSNDGVTRKDIIAVSYTHLTLPTKRIV
eukprot:TRINITY_DN14929_c0_g1_i2.p1 TRINITY_DN14929_c0_g1~~TRINITY_DN14929_c0_g1_i2.p1  ORF type:complete len:236 (-),score=76.07 TRINITY_DN14929_c0_g1_i2:164-871(-)